MIFNWADQSREPWEHDSQPSDAARYIAVGALQRIADSLERIVRLLDPKTIKEDAERKEWDECYGRYLTLYDQPMMQLSRQFMVSLPGAVPPKLKDKLRNKIRANAPHVRPSSIKCDADGEIAIDGFKKYLASIDIKLNPFSKASIAYALYEEWRGTWPETNHEGEPNADRTNDADRRTPRQ